MANLGTTIEDFLSIQPINVDISSLIVALILSALLGFILGKIYTKFGTSLSNREKFGNNFVLLTTTTTLVIFVVKSSLALSLGLVGALSIVRFRAAIKEPEELAFLFLAIGIGLGFGANQIGTTIVASIIIFGLLFIRRTVNKTNDLPNINLTISGKLLKDLTLKHIVDVIKKNASSVHMRRFDQLDDGNIEASFHIELDSFENLEKLKNNLNALSKNLTITYLDKSGIY